MARSTFPDDLMQVQREWDRVYRALAAPRPYGTTELRRRLLLLSARIFTDPCWGAHRPTTGWAELRHQARRREGKEAGGMGDFTERQVRILRWMRTYVAVNGEAPSLREIAAGVGLSSPSSVLYQLKRREVLGAVKRRDAARGRAWQTC
ncbi:LexA family protein [Streptomyces pristinaespiralis]|uniref:LexA family protein n=1 Tax=Streptomyces pristinaespiralis TaxID=38300 RepID=UPI00384DC1B4